MKQDHPNAPAESTPGALKESVSDTAHKLQSKAGEIGAKVRAKGEHYADKTREQAAERVEGVGDTLRETAERSERQHDPNIAHYTRLLADKLQDAAHYVRNHGIEDFRRDAEELARRQPTVFYGGMFVAGMALARFFNASLEDVQEERAEETGHGEETASAEEHEQQDTQKAQGIFNSPGVPACPTTTP